MDNNLLSLNAANSEAEEVRLVRSDMRTCCIPLARFSLEEKGDDDENDADNTDDDRWLMKDKASGIQTSTTNVLAVPLASLLTKLPFQVLRHRR